MQLKAADHNSSNVMEPIINPEDVTVPPNDHTVVTKQSQLYEENAVTGILQPSELFDEEGDVIFCAAIVALAEGNVQVHVNTVTDQPYKLKKVLHVANVSVIFPEEMKHFKQIDQVSTWHQLNKNEEDAIYYISSLPKANRNDDQFERYWFSTPEHLGDEESHTPIQQRIVNEVRNPQEAEKLNLQGDDDLRRKFFCNFHIFRRPSRL